MNTYLIFFGKSQDFTFHAFDSSQYINDFSTVIKDFDELESKTFTIDDVSNNEILSKYNFKKNDKNYSLLKLYSLGQATNGSRIAGSIYGVALLSENEIELTESNNAILNVVKKNFTSLCLEGAKFKMSDFYNQAETIWKAIINHKDGNYFNKITYRNGNFNTNNKVKAFYINDILKNPFDVNNEINNASRLYFSNDLEHLKRTQGKWGKDTFPIYAKENNQYVLYSEKPKPQPKTDQGSQDPEISELRFRNAELRNELSEFERKYRNFKHKASKKFKIASILAVVFCLSTLAFFFKSDFLDDSKDATIVQQSTEQIEGVGNGDETTTEQDIKVNLNDILANDDNRNTLNTLLQNIENFEKPLTGKSLNESKITRYNRIKEDLDELGLEISFAEKFKPNIDNSIITPTITNGQKTKTSVKEKTVKEKTVKDKTVEDKTKTEKTVKEKTVKDKTVEDKTKTDKTVEDKTKTDKTVEDKTATGTATNSKG